MTGSQGCEASVSRSAMELGFLDLWKPRKIRKLMLANHQTGVDDA